MQNTFARRGTLLLSLSASLGVSLLLNGCGGGGSGNSGSGNQGGSGFGFGGFVSAPEEELDADAVVEAADAAAAMSEDERSAALAAADLEGEMALAGPSGLVRELGDEETARAAWAAVGEQMQSAADEVGAGTFGTQSAANLKWPGVRVQADGAGSVGEAFGAGWLGGSLFNALFVQTAIDRYADGKSGQDSGGSTDGTVKATSFLTDTQIGLEANAKFSQKGLSATIATQSAIPCPDVNGLMNIDSSLYVTGEAGSAYQNAEFIFELLVEVDDDAKLTGKNQLKSRTKTHTADSKNGYDTTDGSVDISITEFSDGHFGDPKGAYKGTTEDQALRWMNAGLISGLTYRDHLLPHLQKMLDAGRCVNITVEPSAGPEDLDPFSNVDLLTKPRAKSGNSTVTTHGTVQAAFKVNAGGSILELGEKVEADATFHYLSPADYAKSETVTFEARSKRGTGKLDYNLTTSPHAD